MAAGPRYSPAVKPNAAFLRITPFIARQWVPTLAIWGAGTGLFALTLFASSIPRVKNEILSKTPFAAYYRDDTPECDKPF